MSIQVLVGGVDKSPLMGSLSITAGLSAQATCDMEFRETGGWMPAVGASLEVKVNGSTKYLGSVDSAPRQVLQGGVVTDISIASVDITSIAGRRLAGEYSWTNVKAGKIFRDLVSSGLLGEGIGTTFVADGPDVAAFETNYETVDEALNRLCSTTNMVWRMTWDREARFHAPDAFDAPFSAIDGAALIRNLKITPDRSGYANRVVVRLGQALLPGTIDTISGGGRLGPIDDVNVKLDGAAKSWDLSYRCVDTPVVKLDGVALTVAEEGVGIGQVYWTKGSQQISLDAGQAAPSGASTLEITYTGIAERLVARQNDGAIAERAGVEGGTGIYAISKTLSDPISEEDAGNYAQTLVDTLSQISHVAEFETDTFINPLAATLEVGQRIYISIGGYASPGWYLVRRISWSDYKMAQGVYIRLRVEAANGPVIGDALSWFRQLMGQAGPSAGLSAGAVDATPPDAGGGVTTPTQPAAGDWSLLPLEYSADAAGNQMVHVQANFTGAFPANADFLVFWLYQGATRPSDPGKWVDRFHLAAPGTNGSWIPQPLEAQDWQVCCTACSAEYFATPDASTPLKTVSVAAWKKPLPLQSAAIVAQSLDYNGRVRYRLKVSFTADPADKNFFVCRGDFNWCDSTFTPLAGDNGTWKNVIGSRESPMYIGGNEGFDAPLPENGPQYRQLRLYPIGFDQQPNYTGALIYNLTFLPDGGFRISSLDPSGLDTTMAIKTIGGAKKLAVADGGIGRPQIAAGHDLPQVVSGIPGTLGSRIVYDAATGNVYRWNPAHGAYEWPMDGDAVKAVLAYSKLTSAEFAASIEPVGIVSFVPSVKSASTIYNVADGKTYRWNGSSYVRDTNSTEIKAMLSVDKLQAGQISAGAIGTTELSTAEILIGAGGGKCGRLRINDALGNMIGFHGDDGAGFVGSWASRARFGGTFSSPIIDLSSTGAAIANAALSLVSGQFAFRVNSADGMKVSDDFTGCDVQVKSSGLQVTAGNRSATPPVMTMTPTLLQMDDALHNHTARLGFESIFPIGNAASLNIAYRGTSGISLQSFSGYDRLYSPRFNSRIDFTGGGGYCNIGEYRIGGNVVLDANRNYRFPSVFTEDLVLGGLTASKWVPCYDASGAYQGKIPII